MEVRTYEHIPNVSGLNYVIRLSADEATRLSNGELLQSETNQNYLTQLSLDKESLISYHEAIVQGFLKREVGEKLSITNFNLNILFNLKDTSFRFDYIKGRQLDLIII